MFGSTVQANRQRRIAAVAAGAHFYNGGGPQPDIRASRAGAYCTLLRGPS